MNKSQILTVIVVSIGLSIIMMDTSMMAIALPTIERKMDTSTLSVEWVINAFILTMASFGIISGKLSDIYSTKKLVATGMLLFTLVSVLCFFSSSFIELISFRAIQGISGVLLGAPLMKFLSEVFPQKKLSHGMGISFGLASLSFIIAPILCGQIIKYFNWHYIFLTNIPLTIIGLTCLTQIDINRKVQSNFKINIWGFISLALFLFSAVFIIMEFSKHGFESHLIKTLSIFCISSMIFFILSEMYSTTPLINYNLFKNNKFVLINFIAMLAQAQSISVIFWIMYMQITLEYTPSETGALFMPFYALISISGFLFGKFVHKKGAYSPLLLGSILVFIGYFFTLLLLPLKNFESLIPAMIGASISFTLLSNSTKLIIMNSTEKSSVGVALGIWSNLRQVAGTLSLAILTGISAYFNTTFYSGSYENAAAKFYLGFHSIITISTMISSLILIMSVAFYFINKK